MPHTVTLPILRRLAQGLALALAVLLLQPGAGARSGSPGFAHDDWARVLERFVDARGRVDYEGLAADREILDRYIRAVEAVSPESHPDRFPTRGAELAYYVNAYNAQVVRLVLDRGPEKTSVWSGIPSGSQFFVNTRIEIGGETTNLKKLEDDVIRARYRDPRIHAALNCASIGCPRLPRVAFEPAKLEAQLDAAMREFVSESRNVRLDKKRSTVFLSKIFDWFRQDFVAAEADRGNPDGSVLDFINRFRKDAPIPPGYRIEFLPYDKGLNKQ